MEESSYETKTDEELAMISLQDQQAFAVLIRRYQEKLLRFIHQITAVSHEEAEDILQDGFIKVYYNLNGFDASLKFSSWVYRIIRNEVISAHRKKSVRPQGHAVTIDQEQIRELASELDTSFEVDLSYLRENIWSILNNLDVKYREVLVLRYFEQKDYKELSDILKKSTGTVSSLVSRARKQFVKQAQKQGIEF